MDPVLKLKQLTLLVGDVIVLYLSLGLTLFLRYSGIAPEIVNAHLWPFTFVFIFWIIIFYISGLYEMRALKNDIAFTNRLVVASLVSTFFSMALFYFVPAFGITPKRNLFIFLLIFGLLGYLWRGFYNTILGSGAPPNKILLIGYNKAAEEVAEQIKKNPQLGYEVKFWMKDGMQDKEMDHLAQIILADDINLIVVPSHIKKDSHSAKAIYKNLVLGIDVMDLAQLYEAVFGKVPVSELEEVWFLENLARSHRIYEAIKRPVEILVALLLIPILVPIGLIITLILLITSGTPIIYSQRRVGQVVRRDKRVGKADYIFTLYKFRTMRRDAEKHGPQWSKKGDERVTPFGKLLRRTHLDELPQLINLIRGDVSLVGPRPERPKFVEELKKEIPYYELRHLIRPGITGWAQINYKYGSSIDDAHEKLQFEMYYMKHRSLALDLLIILKTVKYVFTNN